MISLPRTFLCLKLFLEEEQNGKGITEEVTFATSEDKICLGGRREKEMLSLPPDCPYEGL